MLQGLKRRVWNSGEDNVGTYNSNVRPAAQDNMESSDYTAQLWTSKNRQKLIKSSKNSSKNMMIN
jgi:hypothetical protein